MRIFYAAGASPNAYDISQSRLWEHNLLGSLRDMGHEVIAFSRDVTRHFTEYRNYRTSLSDRRSFMRYRSDLQSELTNEITDHHRRQRIDLFFSYFWSEICAPETVDAIRSLGIKTVNWYCNGSYQFDLVRDLAPHYDWCLVPEKFRLKDYAAAGARPIYCQEAANPKIYRPYDVPKEFDVTFVGQAYGDRPHYVRHLIDRGIDVRVWGLGWVRFSSWKRKPAPDVADVARKLLTLEGWRMAGKELRGLTKREGLRTAPGFRVTTLRLPDHAVGDVLSDEEMVLMYSRSRINLGFSSCGDTHETAERILQVRLRDFEVPMSGGFYMVEYMEELEEFFDIGKEIVCYRGPEDLAEKIKYYLAHDAEREAIRRAGRERCLRDHTWQRRFEAAFRQMGLA